MNKKTTSTAFMIFATQRTGSTWLMSLLDAHPAIASYDELLIPGETGSGYWGRTDLEFFEPYYIRRRRHDHSIARALWTFRYLNALYSSRRGTEAIGMKLMYDQLWHNPWVLVAIVRHRVRVIHLVRTNLLDIFLSEETAEARQRYHAWGGDVVDTPAVTLDSRKLTDRLKSLEYRVRLARCLLTLLPISHMEVSYEHLMADPSLVTDIAAFLNVGIQADTPPFASRFTKLNASPKHDLITNYDEVERTLTGTRFERFLTDTVIRPRSMHQRSR